MKMQKLSNFSFITTEKNGDVVFSMVSNEGIESVEIGEATLEIDRNSGTAYLSRIDVYSDRRCGFGYALLSHILQDSVQRGVKHLTAYVNHGNEASLRLFKKAGFSELHRDAWDAQYGTYFGKYFS